MPRYISDHLNSLCVPAVTPQSHIIQSENWKKKTVRESQILTLLTFKSGTSHTHTHTHCTWRFMMTKKHLKLTHMKL